MSTIPCISVHLYLIEEGREATAMGTPRCGWDAGCVVQFGSRYLLGANECPFNFTCSVTLEQPRVTSG